MHHGKAFKDTMPPPADQELIAFNEWNGILTPGQLRELGAGMSNDITAREKALSL